MTRLLDIVRNRIAALLHDLIMVPVAWMGAYWLRFNLEPFPDEFLYAALQALPIVLIIQGSFLWGFGLYRGVWRFASLPDLIRILKAVGMGMAVSAVAIFLVTRMAYMPRSVFPLYGLLLVVLLGGPRMVYRWFKDRKLYVHDGQRVLIAGAGRAGEMLAREMLRTPGQGYNLVGFVDDNRRKWGEEIQGIRVLGPTARIPELARDREADVIIIALPSATAGQMRAIVSHCEQSGIPFQTLPPMDAVVSGQAVLKELREVSIEDLLGRDPVSLDWPAISGGLSGKVVLVTGGGGSIGAELCRQIARIGPSALVVFEQSEYNLYAVEMELQRQFPELALHACLGDVTDRVAVEHVMRVHQPDVVFHAAAYKHVPMLEHQTREAVRNNVLGTRIVARAADQLGCGAFVLISTDKAVNPVNAMGASKRVAEVFCQNLDRQSRTRFITVRFGNVLGSTGSVVPLFRQQIESGGPVTVTHPKMTRYFMTIPEACQLIMQAGVMGEGGEIYVLDMGEAVNITYLAEEMIRLSGKEPGEDIEIVYTGLRPGEKLNEELFHEKELLVGTAHDKILLARHRPVEWAYLENVIEDMEGACQSFDEERLLSHMCKLIPELQSERVASIPDNVIPFGETKQV